MHMENPVSYKRINRVMRNGAFFGPSASSKDPDLTEKSHNLTFFLIDIFYRDHLSSNRQREYPDHTARMRCLIRVIAANVRFHMSKLNYDKDFNFSMQTPNGH